MMRVFPVLVLAILACSAQALEEPNILSFMWEDIPIADLEETVVVLEGYVGDIDNNGYDEAVIITSGSVSTRSRAYKNHISAYDHTGRRLWNYGVDDRIMKALVFDINNDRKTEFIVSAGQKLNRIQRGSIRIISSSGQLLRSFDSSTLMLDMHINDIDGDRYYEIAGGASNRAFLFHGFGEQIWYYPPRGSDLFPTEVGAVYSYDVDFNRIGDVIVGADRLYYLSFNGNLMGQIDLEPSLDPLKKGFKFVEVGNFVGKGYPNTLAVTESDKIFMVLIEEIERKDDYHLLDLIVEWDADLGCSVNDVLTYNLDSDDFKEIIVACSDNRLYALDNNGLVSWDYPLDGEPVDIEVEDMDGDGISDILVAASSGSVYMIDLTGDFKWIHKTGMSLEKISAGDMNADGVKEVVVISEKPLIRAYTINESYTLTRRAITVFNLAQEFYITSQYDKASEAFKQAKVLFSQLGDEKKVRECQDYISQIEKDIISQEKEEADLYYSKAQELFFSMDYSSSTDFAEKAKSLYQKFGNTEGVVKCELLLLQIEKAIGGGTPTVTTLEVTTTTQPPKQSGDMTSMILLALIAVIVIIFVVKARSHKTQSLDETIEKETKSWDTEMKDIESELDKEGGV